MLYLTIFEETQNTYCLTSTNLSALELRILDRYKVLVKALDAIHMRKMEPAVRGVVDYLLNPTTITTLCFLAKVFHFTNIFQCVLQESSLNFLHIKYEICKLIDKLRRKCNNMSKPGSYFYQLDSFFDKGKKSARVGSIYWQIIYPIRYRLDRKEIEKAFEITNHLRSNKRMILLVLCNGLKVKSHKKNRLRHF